MITPDQTGKVAHEIHLSLMMPRAMRSTENQDQISWWDAVDNRALEGHGFETPEIAIEYCKDAILKDMRGEKL